MNANRKDRIEELEGQIRYELDRRISIQVSEFHQRARALFNDDDYQLFTNYLKALLENSDAVPPEGSEDLIQTIKSDAATQAVYSKLLDILRLKDMAIEVSEIDGPGSSVKLQPRLNQSSPTIYLPSNIPPFTQKASNPNELRDALDASAASLAQIFPEPDNWLGWLIYWLEALEKEAAELEKENDYEQILERLSDMISNRLYHKHW